MLYKQTFARLYFLCLFICFWYTPLYCYESICKLECLAEFKLNTLLGKYSKVGKEGVSISKLLGCRVFLSEFS